MSRPEIVPILGTAQDDHLIDEEEGITMFIYPVDMDNYKLPLYDIASQDICAGIPISKSGKIIDFNDWELRNQIDIAISEIKTLVHKTDIEKIFFYADTPTEPGDYPLFNLPDSFAWESIPKSSVFLQNYISVQLYAMGYYADDMYDY